MDIVFVSWFIQFNDRKPYYHLVKVIESVKTVTQKTLKLKNKEITKFTFLKSAIICEIIEGEKRTSSCSYLPLKRIPP